jgi:CubicO group peptidase (beta-lactamase class C family)
MHSARWKLAVAVVALSLCLPAWLAARQAAPAANGLDATLREIDSTVAAAFAKDGVGGLSIGVVSGATLLWSKHYGYADAEAKRAPDNDTTYRVGSITKQFTALALLQLVDQGRMHLTDPLEKYVPEVRQVKGLPAGTPPITLLQVATMHAGLSREPSCADHSVGPVAVWEAKVAACLPTATYVNEPGTTYLYSNIGYASLGLAVERAGGQPFIDQVEARILKPLGMSRSAMDATPAVRTNLAHGYQRNRGSGAVSREAGDRELDGRGYRVPNGALFSTINDLAKFVSWELGTSPVALIKKESQDANYARAFFSGAAMTAGYGVGFQVQRRGDILLYGHGGSTAGYHASALFHRGARLGVIVFRNCDSCAVDAGPVAADALERLVRAAAIR